MSRIRAIFATALMTSMLLVLGVQAAIAQSPTPITIPSPTAEGCDQVPAYLEARQKIFDELIADMTVIFPDVATPIVDHGDELFVAMLSMAPDQYQALAQAYDAAADKIEKLEVPPVASFYNDLQVERYRLSADVFGAAATAGISDAGDAYGEQLAAIGVATTQAGEAATSVCPAFADVVKLDETQAAL